MPSSTSCAAACARRHGRGGGKRQPDATCQPQAERGACKHVCRRWAQSLRCFCSMESQLYCLGLYLFFHQRPGLNTQHTHTHSQYGARRAVQAASGATHRRRTLGLAAARALAGLCVCGASGRALREQPGRGACAVGGGFVVMWMLCSGCSGGVASRNSPALKAASR